MGNINTFARVFRAPADCELPPEMEMYKRLLKRDVCWCFPVHVLNKSPLHLSYSSLNYKIPVTFRESKPVNIG